MHKLGIGEIARFPVFILATFTHPCMHIIFDRFHRLMDCITEGFKQLRVLRIFIEQTQAFRSMEIDIVARSSIGFVMGGYFLPFKRRSIGILVIDQRIKSVLFYSAGQVQHISRFTTPQANYFLTLGIVVTKDQFILEIVLGSCCTF